MIFFYLECICIENKMKKYFLLCRLFLNVIHPFRADWFTKTWKKLGVHTYSSLPFTRTNSDFFIHHEVSF